MLEACSCRNKLLGPKVDADGNLNGARGSMRQQTFTKKPNQNVTVAWPIHWAMANQTSAGQLWKTGQQRRARTKVRLEPGKALPDVSTVSHPEWVRPA